MYEVTLRCNVCRVVFGKASGQLKTAAVALTEEARASGWIEHRVPPCAQHYCPRCATIPSSPKAVRRSAKRLVHILATKVDRGEPTRRTLSLVRAALERCTTPDQLAAALGLERKEKTDAAI